jgi:hypothetical protein
MPVKQFFPNQSANPLIDKRANPTSASFAAPAASHEMTARDVTIQNPKCRTIGTTPRMTRMQFNDSASSASSAAFFLTY